MIKDFNFGDTKQVRKTLMLLSIFGIFFELIKNYSTGAIGFLGFSIPIDNASILPNFIGVLITYFLVALIIRYNDEKFREEYSKFTKVTPERNIDRILFAHPDGELTDAYKKLKEEMDSKSKVNKKSVYFLDIISPILIAIFALLCVFFNILEISIAC